MAGFSERVEVVSEVIIHTDNLADELAKADRAFHGAEDAVNLALKRLKAATDEHRAAGAAWSTAMELRNQRLRERADLLARIQKQERGDK